MRKFLGIRLWIIACFLLVAAAGARGESAPPPPALPLSAGDVGTLRTAIMDLAATQKQRYPNGAKFLAQLDDIDRRLHNPNAQDQQAAQADFQALQRRALVANPLVSGQPIVFTVRSQYNPGHHNTETFFPAAEHECNSGSFTPGGALKILDAATGLARTLVPLPKGVARDPEIDFDGKKIIFSMRKDPADSYHLYEIDCGMGVSPMRDPGDPPVSSLSPDVSSSEKQKQQQDRAGTALEHMGKMPMPHLKQLTFAKDVDDLDPFYLPDGCIGFSSTREPKYCMCNRHIMANLYRMEADGANICQIGKSTLFEGHGSLTPDGRILYDRWEYVDRNFGDAQGLWTADPDGTNHALYWKNNTPSPGAAIDARFIPGTDRVVCTFSACHDRPWGAIAIVDRSRGIDGRPPVIRTWPPEAMKIVWSPGVSGLGYDSTSGLRPKYENPYPLSDKYFLCSRMTGRGEEMAIFLLDVFGNEILLHAEAPGCFSPMPLCPRPRPPVIPTRRNFEGKDGLFYVQDVYQGTHMAGVKPGAVKYLRVVETPEKRFWTSPAWYGGGTEAPGMNWHDFNNKVILGTVPVEADGSAYFAVPSEHFVYFQLLDENHRMIQSMRSGTMVQSGELGGCVGCHDDRRQAPPTAGAVSMAMRRPPSRLDGWHGPAREFSYLRDVQPVFDKNCLACHDYNKPGADKLILAGDREPCFNTSYCQLWARGYIRVVGAGPAETQQAYSWGAGASKIVQVLDQGHHGVKLDPESLDRLATWIDINAPYYPSYATNFPGNFAGRSPLDDAQTNRLRKLLGVPEQSQSIEVSFDRPDLSPALKVFQNRSDPGYQEALSILLAGKATLAKQPGADWPGFVPCPLDQWRDQKYQLRRDRELFVRKAIREGRQVYDAGRT
jgi:hypothetical protein